MKQLFLLFMSVILVGLAIVMLIFVENNKQTASGKILLQTKQ